MRALLAICLLVSASFVSANPSASDQASFSVKGKVLEVRDAQGYTYLRIKTPDGDTWAAVSRAVVKPGADVTIEKAMVMHDFESKAMQRTFKKIVFGNLASTSGTPMDIASAHKGVAKMDANLDTRVAKATGANAHTVADIYTKGGALKDKPVVVRGKVVKYNAGIMGKNWVHLRDGSGSAANGSNDILVTTSETAKVSEVVTVQGIVRNDKDFGAGNVYKVLIEDAKLKR